MTARDDAMEEMRAALEGENKRLREALKRAAERENDWAYLLEMNGKDTTMNMKPQDLPSPDTIIEYEDGSFGPLMWHYATEGDNLKAMLAEQGFEHCRVDMADELDASDPLMVRYDNDDAQQAIADWQPPEIDGWKLVAKHDSEDGPVAHYLRRAAKALASAQEKGEANGLV